MIQFPGRKILVSEAQRALGLLTDGVDGRNVWFTLGTRLLPPGHVATKALSSAPSRPLFQGRRKLVSAIQKKIGVPATGKDDASTWSAILEVLQPTLKSSDKMGGSFTQTVRGRSPNRNSGTNECKGIVFHHASGYFEGTARWCLKPKTYAAYHCLINSDGTRAILGFDSDRLHHAGVSSFKGRSRCNNFMLGVAFVGDTNTGAMRASRHLTADELASAKEWVASKMSTHGITKDWITHHRVVSPNRKDDLSISAWGQVMEALRLL